jgi:hypothetical protein
MDQNLETLILRFRAGDDDAATELYEHFVGEMLRRIRLSLRKEKNPGAFDSEGIFLDAFRSFLSEARKPKFDARQGKVGGLLATIVMRKLYQTKKRRDPANSAQHRREELWATMNALIEGDMTEQELNAELNATIECVLSDFTSRGRKIIKRFFDAGSDGTCAQIARKVRCSETTVEDVILLFMEKLREELQALGVNLAEDSQ